MIIFLIFLIILFLVIGFLFGKYIYDKVKWSDKRKVIDSEWRLKLESLDKNYSNQVLELKKNWEFKYSRDLSEIKELIQGAERYWRSDALKRSKRTLLGRLWEQVSPYLPKFPFKPYDMKFIGSPIDFIIFDGAAENDIKRVIFLEVKSGDSKLSSQERKLKNVIEEGKVSWKLFNVAKPEEIKIQGRKEDSKREEEISPHELYENIDSKIVNVKKEE